MVTPDAPLANSAAMSTTYTAPKQEHREQHPGLKPGIGAERHLRLSHGRSVGRMR